MRRPPFDTQELSVQTLYVENPEHPGNLQRAAVLVPSSCKCQHHDTQPEASTVDYHTDGHEYYPIAENGQPKHEDHHPKLEESHHNLEVYHPVDEDSHYISQDFILTPRPEMETDDQTSWSSLSTDHKKLRVKRDEASFKNTDTVNSDIAELIDSVSRAARIERSVSEMSESMVLPHFLKTVVEMQDSSKQQEIFSSLENIFALEVSRLKLLAGMKAESTECLEGKTSPVPSNQTGLNTRTSRDGSTANVEALVSAINFFLQHTLENSSCMVSEAKAEKLAKDLSEVPVEDRTATLASVLVAAICSCTVDNMTIANESGQLSKIVYSSMSAATVLSRYFNNTDEVRLL